MPCDKILSLLILFSLISNANIQCLKLYGPIQNKHLIKNFKLTGVVFKDGQPPKLGTNWWDGWWYYHGQVHQSNVTFGAQQTTSRWASLPRGFGLQGEIFSDPSWANDASRGIDLVHRSYGKRLSESEKEIVSELDEKNFNDFYKNNQLGYAGVESAEGKLVGFLRVIDGNRGSLPAEEILKSKQIETAYFTALRNANYRIFEIGKYSLSFDLNSAELRKVRNAIFKWLIDSYMHDNRTLEKTIFIIDVSSPIHERAYRNLFGTRKVDQKYFQPELSYPDAILEVSGKNLFMHLQKILSSDIES
ncbi:MAG: hypothetical protein JNL11_03005 [Bdellovibrionaceae bacterium]|nr:hypothetical protein [Pseudobdellovibrionaceae bacterium]